VVVPFTPGGSTDITARLVSNRLQEVWGQSVVVENKPGAGGNIAHEFVARSPNDGYTILNATHMAINRALYKELTYDVDKDFAGYYRSAPAQDFAARNCQVFDPGDVDAIIVNAAGCGAMLKQYGELLADDPAYAVRAHAFSAKVRDATEFLAALPLVAPLGTVRARVTYHDACHLAHGQGIRSAPRDLLRSIPGIELIELADADTCCGSAGSYNLTEPEMARRLGDRKVANIRATGATCIAAANPGCVMQLQASMRRAGLDATVKHPIELLDQAYRDS